MNRDLPDFQYRGARAMVILHERYLREFVEVWKRARISGVKLPQTDDPSYQSWDTLLKHLIRAARGYMVWTCEKLELSDPQINIPTEPEVFAADVDRILEHVLDKWWRPLVSLPEERFFQPVFKSRWEVEYCIDAMLEHAVVHPLRHTLQLEELMAAK